MALYQIPRQPSRAEDIARAFMAYQQSIQQKRTLERESQKSALEQALLRAKIGQVGQPEPMSELDKARAQYYGAQVKKAGQPKQPDASSIVKKIESLIRAKENAGPLQSQLIDNEINRLNKILADIQDMEFYREEVPGRKRSLFGIDRLMPDIKPSTKVGLRPKGSGAEQSLPKAKTTTKATDSVSQFNTIWNQIPKKAATAQNKYLIMKALENGYSVQDILSAQELQ